MSYYCSAFLILMEEQKNDDTANAPSKQACIEIKVPFLFVVLLSKEVINCVQREPKVDKRSL